MPIYEYVCEKCGSHIEVIQKSSDAPLKRCQKCRGKLEKIISRTSFQLKGAGWYVTDYSKPKAPTGNKTEKATEKKSETASTPASGTGTGSSSE